MIPSFEKRVRAFAIDTSGVMLFVIISWALGDVFLELPYIVSGSAFLGFYFVPYIFSKGQTFGKRIQKIRVVNLDGSDVELWKVFLRDMFKLILSIGTFSVYMIVSFFILSDKSGRTVHDYIFKTKVIDLEKPTGKNNFMNKTESMRKRGF
ncbi:MAG: RDD family protein [Acholeplasmataceae bacterium]|nr:RDD family protein [Acholeplasmataceae bacterium]